MKFESDERGWFVESECYEQDIQAANALPRLQIVSRCHYILCRHKNMSSNGRYKCTMCNLRTKRGHWRKSKKGRDHQAQKGLFQARGAGVYFWGSLKIFCSALVALYVMDLPQSADIAQFYIVSSAPDTRFCPCWAGPISIWRLISIITP